MLDEQYNATHKKKRNHEYVGRRLGRLVVTECIEPSHGDRNERGKWLCVCDCGNTITVKGMSLRNHKSARKSCGCLQLDKQKEIAYKRRRPDSFTYTTQYNVHKNSCKREGKIFLTKDQWMNIITKPCNYCGEIDKRNSMTSPSYRKAHGLLLTPDEVSGYEVPCNGVDRVNSSIGYELDNCVPCCADCNYMKTDMVQSEFIRKCGIIYARHAYREYSLESYLCN